MDGVDAGPVTSAGHLIVYFGAAPGVGKTYAMLDEAHRRRSRGTDIVAATAVDANGNALGVVDLEIRLDDRDHLIVTPGRTAFLSIDFDLAASHEVDLSVTPVRVTARPYLVAEVQPVTEKELRVRGALVDVNVAASTYDIRVRPWHKHDGDHGVFTVHTTPTTTFEIGAASYTGTPGLEALDLSACKLITDAGFLHLTGLCGLRTVLLNDTLVSDAALARVWKAG